MKDSSDVSPLAGRAQALEPRRPRDRCEVPFVHADAAGAAREALPDQGALATMAELFSLLANQTRLRLLLALRASEGGWGRELCVCDLAAVAEASESMTSHQLRLLRKAGLVVFRREGKLALYRMAEGPMSHLLADALEHVAK